MPVVIVCPKCQRKVRVPSKAIGKSVRCPVCGETFEARTDEPTPPPMPAPELEVASEAQSEPAVPKSDGGRVERTGVRLLTMAEVLLAISLALQLVVALIQLATSESSPRAFADKPSASFASSVTQVLSLVWVVAQVAAAAVTLVGSMFVLVPATNLQLRARAGTVLLFAALSVPVSGSSVGDMIRGAIGGELSSGIRGANPVETALVGQVWVLSMTPLVVGAALQTMLALYARFQAHRLRDRAAEQLARAVAIGFPAVVIGLFLLKDLARIFGSPSQTFYQVMMVLDELFRTAFVAAGAFVLWRIWVALGER
jgi:hypothetical protein